jgi:hypothetical protein
MTVGKFFDGRKPFFIPVGKFEDQKKENALPDGYLFIPELKIRLPLIPRFSLRWLIRNAEVVKSVSIRGIRGPKKKKATNTRIKITISDFRFFSVSQPAFTKRQHAFAGRSACYGTQACLRRPKCLLWHAGMPPHAEVLRHASMLTHYFPLAPIYSR